MASSRTFLRTIAITDTPSRVEYTRLFSGNAGTRRIIDPVGDRAPPSRLRFWRLIGGVLLFLIAGAAHQATAQQIDAQASKRAVIELFTSQGCAACPPADQLMHGYTHDDSLVVLTLPVTCWDYLGWRDTLAQERFTARQRGYAKARGARAIYTPQAIVNGVSQMVGSDSDALQDALAPAPTSALPVSVTISRNGPIFRVIVTAPQMRDRATILLAPFYRQRTVRVEAGENKDMRLNYANVVRNLVPLAPLMPAPASVESFVATLSYGEALPDNTDGFAILVQSGSYDTPGRMLGAATFVKDGSP